jgi:hypothetical protein
MCDYSLQNVASRPPSSVISLSLVTLESERGASLHRKAANGGLPSPRSRNRFSKRTSHHTPRLPRLATAKCGVCHSDFPADQQTIPQDLSRCD